MRFWAVLEHFDDDQGILLINGGEERMVVSRDRLPSGLKEGDVIKISFEFDAFSTVFRNRQS